MNRNRSSPSDRQLWKVADRIHDRLRSTPRWPKPLADLEFTWHCWEETSRRLRIAQSRNWSGAIEGLRDEVCDTLRELNRRCDIGRAAIEAVGREKRVSPVKDIFHDLMALRDEFPAIECHLREEAFSVVTEPIELDEIYLGEFEIRLSWSSRHEPLDYRVIARDPQPAAKSDLITHPHVEDERLCEGEGRLAIKIALEQGRLFDFFLVVRQILGTYNESSAYVELDNWYGLTCADCGCNTHEDELYTCEDCATGICGDCCRYCDTCGSSACGDCASDCLGCREATCRSCLLTCSRCETSVCKGCLDDKNRLCKNCRTKKETAEEPRETATAATGAKVHAVRVGQAAVPA